MIKTPLIAAVALAILTGSAFAQGSATDSTPPRTDKVWSANTDDDHLARRSVRTDTKRTGSAETAAGHGKPEPKADR
jgi:hypothetical protein